MVGAWLWASASLPSLARVGLLPLILLASLQLPAAAQTANDFAGDWFNVNHETRGVHRLVITPSSDGAEITVHEYGACTPEDCDNGEVSVPFSGSPLVFVHDFKFLTKTVTLCLASPDFLFTHTENRFLPGDLRDYVADYIFHRGPEPVNPGGDPSAFVGSWVSLYPEDKHFDSGIATIRVLEAGIEAVGNDLRIDVRIACQPVGCSDGAVHGTATVPAGGSTLVANIEFRSPDGNLLWGAFSYTLRLLENDLLLLTGQEWDSVLRPVSSPNLCFSPPRPLFHRGDPDANGAINVADSIFLLNSLFQGGRVPPCSESADADNDGKISLTDAVFLLNYLFRGGPQPPSPGPPDESCGADPDPALPAGDLGCELYLPCT